MLNVQEARSSSEWEAEDAELWEAESQHGIGFIRADFDPTNGRRSQLWLTSAAALLYGMHREEVPPPHPILCFVYSESFPFTTTLPTN
jgi:hypothetical protein